MREFIMIRLGRHVSKLSGFAPAIPTPFDQNGDIDAAALERFCEMQIDQGASALVVCGTTGEAPTLTRAEHDRIVRIAVDVAHGRVPVIAGAGSNSTSQAIEFAKDAEAAGADAILSVVPYYNKQADASRPGGPFPGDRQHDRPSDRSLRRPVPHGVQPRQYDDRPTG